MVTVRSVKNLKQAENWLFLQLKSGRILDILWAFITKQLFHSRLLDRSCYSQLISNEHLWNNS